MVGLIPTTTLLYENHPVRVLDNFSPCSSDSRSQPLRARSMLTLTLETSGDDMTTPPDEIPQHRSQTLPPWWPDVAATVFTARDAECLHRIRVLLPNGRSRCARCRRVIETDENNRDAERS